MPFKATKSSTAALTCQPKPLSTAMTTLLSVMVLGGALTACSQPSVSSQQAEQKKPAASAQTAPVAPASATTTVTDTASAVASTAAATMVANISQQFTGNNDIEKRLKQALPEIPFSVDNLSAQAVATNEASFANKALATNTDATQPSSTATAHNTVSNNASVTSANQKASDHTLPVKVDKQQALHTKIQALLNWHQFGVGAVDGKWGKNTVKAMQAFQQAHNLPITATINEQTWQALSDNPQLNTQPALVNYTLTQADANQTLVKIPAKAADKATLDSMGYERVTEALAEKFHMDEQYLKALNPKATYQQGETITVFNPGQPNLTAVTRVVADKTKQ